MPTTKPMSKADAEAIVAPDGVTPGGPTRDDNRDGRTAVDKVVAQSGANIVPDDKSKPKTLVELANGSAEEKALAFQQLVNAFPQLFNIDFTAQAPLHEILGGVAHARGAISPTGEDPQLVDDQTIPPGVNNPTGEILPPNIMAGSPEAKKLGFGTDDH